MLFRRIICLVCFSSLCLAELPDHFFSQISSSSQEKFIGRISITDRKNGITEATWLYVKAALDAYKKERPRCIILELDTPGGELFAAEKISNALKSFDAEEGIPVIAYVNNWAVSAGALLAYSCRYIVVAKDATMGAATPVYEKDGNMTEAPEKVNSVVRAEFANKAALFGRNQDVARAMVDPDSILVRRGDKIIALHDASELKNDEVISPKGKLLTLTAQELLDLHVADYLVEKPFAESLPIKTFEMTPQEKIVAFFATPAVSSLLIFVALICFYIEFSTPGVAIPGLIGGVALFLVLVGSFAQEAITWFEPLCLLAGLLLVFVEVFFFPTLGILLLVGGLLSVFGLLGILIPGLRQISFEPGAFTLFGGYLLNRLGWLSGTFLLALVTGIFIARFLTRRPFRLSGIILPDSMPTHVEQVEANVGDRATVSAPMRPSGKILLNGRLLSAMSRGEFIEQGEEVTITEIRGNTIIVERRQQ